MATMDTVVPMNIEVPTKYPLSHNDRIVVFEIRLHRVPDALQTSTPWQLKCFESLKDKFPTPTISTHSCVAKSSGISARPCTSAGGGVRLNSLEGRYLQTISYGKITVE